MPATAAPDRIDVHVHFLPDFYRDTLRDAGQDHPDGIAAIPDWSEDAAIQIMDKLGVKTAVLSISSPGVHFGDDAKSRELCRKINEYSADLKKRDAGRFGQFASLPLPDVKGAVAEAVYALDELGAEGVVVQSNHHGMYLGDEKLEPLWAALNEREAVVFVHPTAPPAVNSERVNEKIPQPVMEFFFDTSRSLVDLITAGVLKRHDGIKVIVPHAGSVLPILTNRIDSGLQMLKPSSGGEPTPTLHDAMRMLHFDLAGLPIPELLTGLLSLADHSHLHYGTDFPYTTPEAIEKLLDQLETTPLLDQKVRAGMFGGNARKLFPGLA